MVFLVSLSAFASGKTCEQRHCRISGLAIPGNRGWNRNSPVVLEDAREGVRQMMVSSTEKDILQAIFSYGEHEPYGNEIASRVHMQRQREMSIPVMHSALFAMEKKGLVTNRRGEATIERGGYAKYHYKLTEKGKEILHER